SASRKRRPCVRSRRHQASPAVHSFSLLRRPRESRVGFLPVARRRVRRGRGRNVPNTKEPSRVAVVRATHTTAPSFNLRAKIRVRGRSLRPSAYRRAAVRLPVSNVWERGQKLWNARGEKSRYAVQRRAARTAPPLSALRPASPGRGDARAHQGRYASKWLRTCGKTIALNARPRRRRSATRRARDAAK